MEVRFNIPPHLEGWVGEMNQDSLDKLMSFLIEFAISHKMLNYPELLLERQIGDMSRTIALMYSEQQKFQKEVLSKIDTLTSKANALRSVEEDKRPLYKIKTSNIEIEEGEIEREVIVRVEEPETTVEDVMDDIFA